MKPPFDARFALASALVLVMCTAPDWALAQTLGGASEPKVSWWRVLGALILCVALAIGAAVALKARMRGQPPLKPGRAPPGLGPLSDWMGRLMVRGDTAATRGIQLIESRRLSHQVDICHLRFDEHDFLLAVTAQGVTLLNRSSSPTENGEGEG